MKYVGTDRKLGPGIISLELEKDVIMNNMAIRQYLDHRFEKEFTYLT